MIEIEILLRLGLIILVSYLLGSIPVAYLVCRLNSINIFAVGSGNMGATNVIRALTAKYTQRLDDERGRIIGIAWGLVAWFFDSLKGVVAILIAAAFLPQNHTLATVVAAFFAIIGHTLSIWAWRITGRLRGGKGAATAFGCLILIVPPQIIAAMLLLGMIVVGLTRYVSLAVLLIFGMATAWMIVLFTQRAVPVEYLLFTLAMAALLFVRFRENIQRLLAGTERRLGEGA